MIALDDIMAAVESYVRGVADQNRAALTNLFSPAATITGIDEGRWISVPRDRWIDFVCADERRGAGAPDYRIVAVLIAGTVGTAEVRTRFGRFAYRDVLSVVATGEGTRIVCKTFHQDPPD